ncbi:MAG: hypothetical protein ACKVP7_23895 [Hyphomicrobiaceae bacterium]
MAASDPGASSGKARRIGLLALLALGTLSAVGIYWLTAGGGAAWVATTIRALDAEVKANFLTAIVIFSLLAFVLQLLVLPTGTITMLTGGFIFGAPIAAFIYYVAQLFAAPLVHGASRLGFGRFADEKIAGLAERDSSGRLAGILHIARSEGVLAAVALRLAPVITSPLVPIIAATAGITLKSLMIGSVLASWIRPLFWASVGATVHSVAQITNPSDILAKVSLKPLLLAFAAAALLFVARIYLKMRTERARAERT